MTQKTQTDNTIEYVQIGNHCFILSELRPGEVATGPAGFDVMGFDEEGMRFRSGVQYQAPATWRLGEYTGERSR